ncbi:uncharacterized protein LOC111704387 [Eurytemora carolleeae]|uniref:uncharacterized protein LOC111704387 n=1 Tax=Eurytemora carolleeae TaxID=1294199 RepID=UPI000C788153|nr:uncharacterized protein LOC111704387 [Eurytemora carolleeae]|eukprot:XP_023332381.1 uncharacterized protein LOC111704387 [Eurytemora affinis]
MISKKKNYNKKIAPFKYEAETKEYIPADIVVSITLRDILRIEEINHGFTLKFLMEMEWYDYRLNYFNLKVNQSLNALSTEEVQNIWIPFILFDNTEHNDATKGDEDTEMTITRN